MDRLQECKIYKLLIENLKRKNRFDIISNIQNLIKNATDKLKLVRDTFPTYTLHDSEHCYNVLSKIELFISDELNVFTDLELFIIIISTYYHDIGMVYDEEYKKSIIINARFGEFLSINTDVALRYYVDSKIDDDAVEAFCRYYHADNSYDTIMEMDDTLFMWESNICVKEEIAIICRSHNMDIKSLNSPLFDTDYIYEADLKICAILLRLGDILDFDNSRTPNEIYKYLKLNTLDSDKAKKGNIEWLKHLSSNGLSINKDKNMWQIIACPKTPLIQNDLLCFLDIIEGELLLSYNTLKACSALKQNLVFPLKIDRTKIVNKDFIYGDYKFSISNNNLINLFMGENLYSDKYVFIRELIQNAIDTTMHRVLYESKSYDFYSINISTYIDAEGYSCFDIIDKGMGMNLGIIQNYLLKVGASYYESAEFKVQLLKMKKQMTPISKYGIGLLSCFLVSNDIKIYTRHINSKLTYCINLDGVNGFFSISKLTSSSKEFLNDFGTRIIVKISTQKEEVDFNFENYISKVTLYSNIRILHNNNEIEQNLSVITAPWCERCTEDLSYYKNKILNKLYKQNFNLQSMKLEIYPINISELSYDSELKGQGIICKLDVDNIDDLLKNKFSDYENRELKISFDASGCIELNCSFSINLEDIYSKKEKIITKINQYIQEMPRDRQIVKIVAHTGNIEDVSRHYNDKIIGEYCNEFYEIENIEKKYFDLSNTFDKFKIYFFRERGRETFRKIARKNSQLFSHNGVTIEQRCCQVVSERCFGFVSLSLYGSLRPKLGLSRSELISNTWEFYVKYNYALIKFKVSNNLFNMDMLMPFEQLNIENLIFEKLYVEFLSHLDEWCDFPLLRHGENIISINKIARNKWIDLKLLTLSAYNNKVLFSDIAAMILIHHKFSIKFNHDDNKFMITTNFESNKKIMLNAFPPMFFVYYSNSNSLKKYKYPVNANHPFSKWFIGHGNYLLQNHSEIFKQLIKYIGSDSVVKRASYINELINRIKKLDINILSESIPTIHENDFI